VGNVFLPTFFVYSGGQKSLPTLAFQDVQVGLSVFWQPGISASVIFFVGAVSEHFVISCSG
jgi:hypothetical protein